MPLAEKLALLKGLFLPIMIIVWVLGSIYGGIASVTEFGGHRRLRCDRLGLAAQAS